MEGTVMDMSDNLSVRAKVRRERLQRLALHCRRRGWRMWADPDWGKWAAGPQEMKRE